MKTDTLGVYPVDEMIEKSGKILTISRVLEKDRDEYWVKEMGFTWTNEMFEEVPIPDCTTYINTSSDSCNPHWQPLTAADFGKISSITMTVDDMKKSIEKENSKMDFNEIIEIYKRRKEKEYQKQFDKESLKLTEKDEIVKIIKKAEKEINTKFIKEFEEEICLGRFITKETNKKREEIRAEFNKKYVELNVLLEEVQAQIKAIPNDTEEKYYFAIEILKNYEILDEKGRINA